MEKQTKKEPRKRKATPKKEASAKPIKSFEELPEAIKAKEEPTIIVETPIKRGFMQQVQRVRKRFIKGGLKIFRNG